MARVFSQPLTPPQNLHRHTLPSLYQQSDAVIIYYKVSAVGRVTLAKLIRIFNTCIQMKWKSCQIKKIDKKSKSLYLQFPYKIRKCLIEKHLLDEGYLRFVNISGTSTLLNDQDILKKEAQKKKKEREEKMKLGTKFQITPVNYQMAFEDLKTVLENSLLKKWNCRIEKQSGSIKEVYISFRRKIALTTIQNYLKQCGLINLINVDVIHKIPRDESYEKFQAIKLKY